MIIMFAHNRTTALLSERLALSAGMASEVAARVRLAATLHDIGKTKIPSDILDKPGKLSAEEFDTVKLHTAFGYLLLQVMRGSTADMARTAAMYHHERYDGKGYWGMPKEQQPLYVQIIALADVFEALVSERVYKPAWPVKDAITYIDENAGTQFNPDLVERFIPLVQNWTEMEDAEL